MTEILEAHRQRITRLTDTWRNNMAEGDARQDRLEGVLAQLNKMHATPSAMANRNASTRTSAFTERMRPEHSRHLSNRPPPPRVSLGRTHTYSSTSTKNKKEELVPDVGNYSSPLSYTGAISARNQDRNWPTSHRVLLPKSPRMSLKRHAILDTGMETPSSLIPQAKSLMDGISSPQRRVSDLESVRHSEKPLRAVDGTRKRKRSHKLAGAIQWEADFNNPPKFETGLGRPPYLPSSVGIPTRLGFLTDRVDLTGSQTSDSNSKEGARRQENVPFNDPAPGVAAAGHEPMTNDTFAGLTLAAGIPQSVPIGPSKGLIEQANAMPRDVIGRATAVTQGVPGSAVQHEWRSANLNPANRQRIQKKMRIRKKKSPRAKRAETALDRTDTTVLRRPAEAKATIDTDTMIKNVLFVTYTISEDKTNDKLAQAERLCALADRRDPQDRIRQLEASLFREPDSEPRPRRAGADPIVDQARELPKSSLTHNQYRFLMSEFGIQAHPDAAHVERLAREIPGYSPRQVAAWFRNRRAQLLRLASDGRDRMARPQAFSDPFDKIEALLPPLPADHRSSFGPGLANPDLLNLLTRNQPNLTSKAGNIAIIQDTRSSEQRSRG